MSSGTTWHRVIAVAFMFVSPVLLAAEGDGSVFGDHWGFRVGLDYSSWDGLGDLEPAGRGGPYKTTGIGLELEGYTSIAKAGDNWIFAGVSTGVLGFNTSLLEDDFSNESALDAIYLSALLKYRFREPGQNYVEIDLGLGYYLASAKYIDCVAIPDCFSADADVDALGGFVGLSGRLLKGLVIGARAHFADFGTIEAIGPDSGNLSGPIYMAYVSWEFGRW